MSASPESPVRVALVGTGTVGRDLARIAAAAEDFRIVSACSQNAAHIGSSLDALAAVEGELPIVTGDIETALGAGPDVLVIATASRLAEIADALRRGVAAGCHVITTAEEAAYPWVNDAALAAEVDAASRAAGVTVLGTGVNPGFAFDALVVTASGAAWDVRGFDVQRILDVSGYSPPILRGLGIGYSPAAFEAGSRSGTITGHIGFPQSMHVVAHALGRQLDHIERTIEPIFSPGPLDVNGMRIGAGDSAGFSQHYVGLVSGEPWFTARLTGHVQPVEAGLVPRDVIEVQGSVPVRMLAEPGLNSQRTVAAVVANSLRRVVAAAPGWLTVADLPPARPYGNRRPQPQTARAAGE